MGESFGGGRCLLSDEPLLKFGQENPVPCNNQPCSSYILPDRLDDRQETKKSSHTDFFWVVVSG